MKFVSYDPTKRDEWDQFVLANPQASFGHLSANFLFTEENAETINRSILIYKDSMHLAGILPLVEVKDHSLPLIKVRTLASPAGPLFLANLPPSEQKNLLDSLILYVHSMAERLCVDRIKITYPSVIQGKLAVERFGFLPLRKYGYNENNLLGTYLDLSRSESDLIASLENTCRSAIRKAEKEGVTIVAIENREQWLSYKSMNEQTLGKSKHSQRTMEIVWDEFISKGYAYAFVAIHETLALSVVLVQRFHQCAYYWMAFNAIPRFPGANNCVLWHAIQHAKQSGSSFFLMGTLEFSDDTKMQGISDFKKRFGGCPYYVLGGTFVRRKIKHHFLLSFAEAARLTRDKARECQRRLKRTREAAEIKPPKQQQPTSLSKAG